MRVDLPSVADFDNSKSYISNFYKALYNEPQKKRHTKKYNSQFSLHLYNEIVYMCNDKILVQR